MLGVINEIILNYDKFNVEELENIYSISAGSWIGLLLCLKIDFDTILNYFIERPWDKFINFTSDDIFNLYDTKGLIDSDKLYSVFNPFFKIRNFNRNLTLKELYEYSNIKLNIYATKYSDLEMYCFNYINTPEIRVIDAIFMSSTIPILFKPLKYKDEYYLDGGYNANNPLYLCLKEHHNKNEILGIETIHLNKGQRIDISKNDDIISFYSYLIYNLISQKRTKNESNLKKHNKIVINAEYFTFAKFLNMINNREERIKLIKLGDTSAKTFLLYLKS